MSNKEDPLTKEEKKKTNLKYEDMTDAELYEAFGRTAVQLEIANNTLNTMRVEINKRQQARAQAASV